jgi:hypothetical protein
MDHRAAWQYAIFVGFSTWSLLLLADVLTSWVGGRHLGLGSMIVQVSVSAVSASAGLTWARQRRLHRCGSQQRYSEPGPMLPYVGLTASSPEPGGSPDPGGHRVGKAPCTGS